MSDSAEVTRLDEQFRKMLPGKYKNPGRGCGTCPNFDWATGGARSSETEIECQNGTWTVKEGKFILYDQSGEKIFDKEVSWANWYQTCSHIKEDEIRNLVQAYRKALGHYV